MSGTRAGALKRWSDLAYKPKGLAAVQAATEAAAVHNRGRSRSPEIREKIGRTNRSKTSTEQILTGKHNPSKASRVKRRLIHDGTFAEICAICHNGPVWQCMSLTLQLDHIDGDRDNWAVENLRLLCPNCHSQTPTYAGKRNRRN